MNRGNSWVLFLSGDLAKRYLYCPSSGRHWNVYTLITSTCSSCVQAQSQRCGWTTCAARWSQEARTDRWSSGSCRVEEHFLRTSTAEPKFESLVVVLQNLTVNRLVGRCCEDYTVSVQYRSIANSPSPAPLTTNFVTFICGLREKKFDCIFASFHFLCCDFFFFLKNVMFYSLCAHPVRATCHSRVYSVYILHQKKSFLSVLFSRALWD